MNLIDETFGASTAQAREKFLALVPMLDDAAIRTNRNYLLIRVEHEGLEHYPAFQIATPEVRSLVNRVLTLFKQDPARTSWQNALWFASANGWLGGVAPADLLEIAPDRVLDAAHQAMRPNDY